MNAPVLTGPAAITPGLRLPDPVAAYWVSQVHIRLRREVGWCWHQRFGRTDPQDGALPPTTERSGEILDWVRFEDQKRRFFTDDPTGEYLSASLKHLQHSPDREGVWALASHTLKLDDTAQFLLALGVAQRLDAGLGPVFASCTNDLSRPFPTAALAQRLWDDPAAIARTLIDDHPLFSCGLLRRGDGPDSWQWPLEVMGRVANALTGLDSQNQLEEAPVSDPQLHRLDSSLEATACRLAHRGPESLEIIPLRSPADTDYPGWAAALTSASGRPLWLVPDSVIYDAVALCERSTLAWLSGADLMLPNIPTKAAPPLEGLALRCLKHPVRWFVPVHGPDTFDGLPSAVRSSDAILPSLTYDQRLALLLDGLGADGERLRDTVRECARRFRLEAPAIRHVTAELRDTPGLDPSQLTAACHGVTRDRHDDLTQRVIPRFKGDDLVLPPAQRRQFREIFTAMRTLTEVHYRWGTARVWNEGGLAVLFCGPPGTGKTMAAEALASELELDLYRIDLSQVVNKYIGETEKNLRRVFDAAEASDSILFFDEADALFGKRTEVKDAHDRFANIEISYLLERMERFKGLAILATNRRKDLDEAFLRRLRYVIEFPMPGVPERERIWRASIPAHVDAEELDFHFLAKQFSFAGGHIRSVIFNACLQAASSPPESQLPAGKVGRLTMRDVLVQVKRELDKLNRAAGDEQFGSYAGAIAEWAA